MATNFEDDVIMQNVDVNYIMVNNITVQKHSLVSIGELMITGEDLAKLLDLTKRMAAEMFPEELI